MEKEYLAYVGIDFGTSGSTFSYWFPDSKSDNKESIKIKPIFKKSKPKSKNRFF